MMTRDVARSGANANSMSSFAMGVKGDAGVCVHRAVAAVMLLRPGDRRRAVGVRRTVRRGPGGCVRPGSGVRSLHGGRLDDITRISRVMVL